MRRFGAGTAGRKGRLAGRPIASLLVAWITMVALVIYQMPALAGAAQAMPLPMAAPDVAAPCDEMGQAIHESMAGMTAMPHAGMPCCDTAAPDAQKRGAHSCPLMGGCFSMCASITLNVAGIQVSEPVAEHALSPDDVGTPRSVPPLQRPPNHL